MILTLGLFLSIATAKEPPPPDLVEVDFKVWANQQREATTQAEEKLREAAKERGYKDIKSPSTKLVCSLVYCNVHAEATGVK